MRRRARPDAGFSYLGLLMFVAITAAALAALGQSWSQAAQRERERELEFRGGEIARAIVSYRRALPAPALPQSPRSLADLLEDRRSPRPLHHLRRAYADPFTGLPDWVLIADPAAPERFQALRSRSEHALLRQQQPNGSPLAKASDWVFAAVDYEAAPAASGAASPVP
ncbi:MAG: type II secretion system protein [Burkholderiaceae bacterium]